MQNKWNTSWIKNPFKGLTWKEIRNRGVKYYKTLTKKQRIIAGIVAGSLLIGSTVLTTHYVTNLNMVYRVFVDGKEIGVISNGYELEKWMDEELNDKVKKYPKLFVHFDKKVYYKKDAEYKGVTNNRQVFDYLNKNVHAIASAQALIVNDEVIAYAKDQKTITNTLDNLKSIYSGKPVARAEGVLTASTSNQTPAGGKTNSLPGDPTVTIKENVKTVAKNVSPEKVLNDEQLLQLLQKGELEPKKYVVKSGDTYTSIAKRHGIKINDLRVLNPQISKDKIKPGNELNVKAFTPKITVLTSVQEEAIEVIKAPVEVRSDSSMYRGDEKVISSGKDGKRHVKYYIAKENGIVVTKKVLEETILNEASKRVVVRGTKVKSDRGTGSFRMPAYGYISSGYGYRGREFHKGIDIAGGGNGSPIFAADNGRVVRAGWYGGYGNCIIIDHGNGFRTLYGHMSSLKVRVGQVVHKGQVIAGKGTTGNSTGVHLHFEIIKNGKNVNPMSYMR